MAGRAAQSERADDNMPLPRDQAYYKKAVEEVAEKNWDSSLSAFEKVSLPLSTNSKFSAVRPEYASQYSPGIFIAKLKLVCIC